MGGTIAKSGLRAIRAAGRIDREPIPCCPVCFTDQVMRAARDLVIPNTAFTMKSMKDMKTPDPNPS